MGSLMPSSMASWAEIDGFLSVDHEGSKPNRVERSACSELEGILCAELEGSL